MAGASVAFPRGTCLPTQSPIFWAAEKDRYLRQLLLRDLETRWSRQQIVYFTRCDSPAQIDQDDDRLMAELLNDCHDGPIDLHLETNGGYTDATEKIISMLGPIRARLRVIIGRRAKSNGTLIALAADEIVMGPVSELGPIDPYITVGPNQTIPAQFVLNAPDVDPILKQIASFAMMQTQTLARTLLETGQFSARIPQISQVVEDLSTRNVYPSHGSVIDVSEADRLGLRIKALTADDDDWKWIWLLRCIYETDAKRAGLVKIFEGRSRSNGVRQQ